eukprot:c28130_g1_i1 orf=471-2045(+)
MKSKETLKASFSHRYQRSKGVKVKHAIQLVMLLIIITWVSFQFKHSRRDKPTAVSEKVEYSGGFLVRTPFGMKNEIEGSLFGRKGGEFDLDVDDHPDQLVNKEEQGRAVDEDMFSTSLAEREEEEETNIDINELNERSETDGDATAEGEATGEGNEDDGTQSAKESQDAGDGDDDGEERGVIEGDAIAELDESEDFFNEGLDSHEEIDNFLSESDEDQTESDEGIENDDAESVFSQLTSETDTSELGLGDIEGEEGGDRRDAGRSEHLQNIKDIAEPKLNESIQKLRPFNEGIDDSGGESMETSRTKVVDIPTKNSPGNLTNPDGVISSATETESEAIGELNGRENLESARGDANFYSGISSSNGSVSNWVARTVQNDVGEEKVQKDEPVRDLVVDSVISQGQTSGLKNNSELQIGILVLSPQGGFLVPAMSGSEKDSTVVAGQISQHNKVNAFPAEEQQRQAASGMATQNGHLQQGAGNQGLKMQGKLDDDQVKQSEAEERASPELNIEEQLTGDFFEEDSVQ